MASAISPATANTKLRSAWPSPRRDGVPTAIYYPIPLHKQQAYKQFPVGKGGVANSEKLADEVISLPMHPYLDEPTQDRVIDSVRRALKV